MSSNWCALKNLYFVENSEERTNRTSLKGLTPRRFSNAFTIPAARPVMRYMPTYRLEPKYPLNREICENIIKNVMDKTFEDYVYTAKNSLNICAHASEEIKNRIKNQYYDRYRYICVVTVGEKLMQGFKFMLNFLWDPTKDGYISYVHDKPQFFAVAAFYYLYYD